MLLPVKRNKQIEKVHHQALDMHLDSKNSCLEVRKRKCDYSNKVVPAPCDPAESRPPGYRQEEVKPRARHMHARALSWAFFFRLQDVITQVRWRPYCKLLYIKTPLFNSHQYLKCQILWSTIARISWNSMSGENVSLMFILFVYKALTDSAGWTKN